MTELLNVPVVCPSCRKQHFVTVAKDAYQKWRRGEGLIQNLMPELSASERELLISGVCGFCFDSLFPPEED